MNLFNPYRTLRGRHCYLHLLSEQDMEALTAETTHPRSQSSGAHSAFPKHNVKWQVTGSTEVFPASNTDDAQKQAFLHKL